MLRKESDFDVGGKSRNGLAGRGMEEAGGGRKRDVWFGKGRCTLPIKVECRCNSDCCWVEVNLATLTCWGYCHI